LFWSTSTYLLAGPRFDQTCAILDEFLDRDGAHLIRDPLKRAFLQHDLWTLFDLIFNNRPDLVNQDGLESARAALRPRLARAIRALALSTAEIRQLPDNLAQAVASGFFPVIRDPTQPETSFLPPGLVQAETDWVSVQTNAANTVPAPSHTSGSKGNSAFAVMINLPDGRDATVRYLRTLSTFSDPLQVDPMAVTQRQNSGTSRRGGPDSPLNRPYLMINPELPTFPVGTQVALVRKMMVIDDQGRLTGTPITLGIQLRYYNQVEGTRPPRQPPGPNRLPDTTQNTYEFLLERRPLFAGQHGGLVALGRDDYQYMHIFAFNTPRDDPIPNRVQLFNDCLTCHNPLGVRSFNTYADLLRNSNQPPTLSAASSPMPFTATAAWKQKQPDWNYLQGFWSALPANTK
jgi:hypothetical protein